jgi:Tfp pilus assembly protein PilN
MINLLPPTLKEQLRYAKLNRLMLRYLRLLVLIVIVLAGVFGASIYFLNAQADRSAKVVETEKAEIASYAPTVTKARDAAERLNAIKYIQGTQTKFSLLLDDLAKVLPTGVSIDSITLTGDDTKPVRVSVTGNTYDSLLSFRNALAGSSRISGVDLESITQGDKSFSSSVVIGFKPGAAK